DLTFANVLRSMVRQDPDVIMIGEMRDLETAQIAVQSALTGHLVLSTLHTNDAPGAITRLLDMGVDDYLVNSTVNAVLGQRLVRTLCRGCRRPYRASSELVDRLQLRKLAVENEIVLHRAVGCEICGQLGYTGRVGIFEILPVTDELRDLIMKHADIPRMRQSAVDAGMVTMFEDGLRKAVAGQTTIEEVRRVTQEH
ncbi:MAG: Flp pilus assembly complex ATPase component TadA, partial [Kiloniellales bacterium]|nr:Flp pilus assembly complex ATPase component TadA [Kiloniellales bacterium]